MDQVNPAKYSLHQQFKYIPNWIFGSHSVIAQYIQEILITTDCYKVLII